MAIELHERRLSQSYSGGSKPSVTRTYWAAGSTVLSEIYDHVVDNTPLTFNPYPAGDGYALSRTQINIEPEDCDTIAGTARWDVEIVYGVPEPYVSGSSGGDSGSQAESSVSVEIGGGSAHISNSKQTLGRYAVSGAAPDFKTLIGVHGDNVAGCDIVVPKYDWTETIQRSTSQMLSTYRRRIYELSGKVNNAAFRGFAAGEVLIHGASESFRGSGISDVTFKFSASPNMTEFFVGDVYVESKRGWDYMWIKYSEEVDDTAKSLVRRPSAVYVEKVYDSGDFSLLNIGA